MDNMLICHGVASGRFLEIGCTGRATLALMKGLNWEVTAVSLDTTSDLFQVANFAADSFDVVYLGGGVIGHVASPRQLLAEARRILRPRGLLVLRTPNARSGFATLTLAAARVTHGSWAASSAPQQLHEFTRKSLRILLESLDYQVAWNRAEARSGLLAAPIAAATFERIALMPARIVGKVLDVLSRGGSEIFLGARKPQHGALSS
jgi:SAM-dependent methyltransferase